MPKKITNILTIIIISILASLSIFLIIINFYYKDRFYPRTKIAGISVSGQTEQQTKEILNKKLNKLNKGIKFQSDNYNKKIKPELIGIEIDLNKTIEQAYQKTRAGKKLKRSSKIIKTIWFGDNNELQYSITPIKLKNFYEQELYPLGQSIQETALKYENDQFEIIPGQPGSYLNDQLLTTKVNKRINHLSAKTIEIPFKKIYPKVEKQEIHQAKLDTNLITSEDIVLTYNAERWEIPAETLKSWISFSVQENKQKKLHRYDYLTKNNLDISKILLFSLFPQEYNKEITAYLDRQKVGGYLANNIAPIVNQSPQNAKVAMVNNQLQILTPAKKGRELLIDANFENIINKIKEQQTIIKLLTKEKGAEINNNNIDELGIKELIGKGESSFAGSPSNRIHNINIAAEKLNGILIKPEEEYSLVQNIGEVNEETGYKPELVIKEDKTIPEYGGGVCQIATTNFRAVMNSGLPITERQSHSYSVQYYDPPGTDATIYIPRPDFRFVNDTNHYILVQTSIYGTNLIFEFYGTKDGREVVLEGPEEWEHKPDKSFKAKWTQIIKYPDGQEKKSTYFSFYDNPDKFKHAEEEEEEEEEENKEEEKSEEEEKKEEQPAEEPKKEESEKKKETTKKDDESKNKTNKKKTN